MSFWTSLRKRLTFVRKRKAGHEPSSLFGVPIKTANWVKGNDMVMFYNGVDQIVRLDGTSKEARKTIKEPQMVVYHAGEVGSLKDLRAKIRLSRELAPPQLNKKRGK